MLLNLEVPQIWSLAIRASLIGIVLLLLNYVFNIKKVLFGTSAVRKSKPIGQLKCLPLVGNALQLVKTSWIEGVCPNAYTLQAISGLTKVFEKERMYKIKLGPNEFYILYNADHVEKVLKSTTLINKPPEYSFFEPWLGQGLLTSQGSKWKSRRKLLTPTFHFKILDTFQPIMFEKSQLLVEKLRPYADGNPNVIMSKLMLCTLDIICETAMGYPVNALLDEDKDNPFVKHLHYLSEGVFHRILRPWLWPRMFWNISPTGREFNKSNHFVQNFIKKVISERKAQMLAKDPSDILADRPAFLDLLLQQQIQNGNLNEEDIREEVNTFMFAGQDTTAAGVNWCLFLLGQSQNLDIQDKVAEELYQIFGDDNTRPITLEDLKEMKYTECVIKEGQRIYPSIPVIGRKIDQDCWIDDILIPNGSAAVIMNRELGHDPVYFPDPTAFKPERFLPENSGGRNPFSYVPFSAGPRNCVGQRFAILETKTVLTNILRNFSVTSIEHLDEIAISPEIVSRPSKPIRFRIRPRVYKT